MTDFATLVLGADTRGLVTGAKTGETALLGLGATGEKTKAQVVSGASAMSAGFKALAVSAVGVLTVASAWRSLTGAIGRIDSMDEAAQSIDGTVNALRALQLATGEAGISQGDLMVSMQSLNRELAKAQAEGGPAAKALESIGLTAAQLSQMDADKRLAAIADAMKTMGFSAGQATAVLQDLGIRSKELSVALLGGGDAIRAARADIASLGLELNQNTVNAVAKANDALGRMGLASEVLGNKLSAALAPALDGIATAMVDSLKEGGALRVMLDGLTGAIKIAAAATPYLISGVAALGVAYAVSLLPAVGAAIGQMIALEMALGAVGVTAALTSIGIKALSLALALTPVGLIMAAGAGLYALTAASAQAGDAASIQARAETELRAALDGVNGSGATAVAQGKELAQSRLDQAKATILAAQSELEMIKNRQRDLAGTRAGIPLSMQALAVNKELEAAQAQLRGIVAEAERAGIALKGVPESLTAGAAAGEAMTKSLAEQYGYVSNMRPIFDADLASAQAMLAAQEQKSELARLSLQYGSDSVQVANAHREAELGVLEAQLNQLGITGAVKEELLQSANAGLILEEAMNNAGGAAATVASRAGLIAGVLWPAVEAAQRLATALGGAVSALGGLASGMARMTAIGQATASAGGVLGGLFNASNLRNALGAFSGASNKIRELYATSVKAAGAGKTLASALGSTGSGGVAGGAKAAAKELTEAEKATQKYQETMQGFVEGGIGKAVDWMVSGFKGGLKGLLGIFKSTISQMIAYAVKNKIMISLGMGGAVGGAGGALAGAVGGGGGAGGSGMFSGILTKIGGVATSFISGASGLVTSLFGAGGGFGAAGTYLTSVMGGATASLGGFAAAAGALALPVLAIAGIFSFFKKKTKELDSGMKVTVTGLDTLVETFKTIQTTRFWGLSKKTKTTTVAASDELADPIHDAYLAIRANVVSMAAILGRGSDALATFTARITLSTAGMTQEQAQEAVLKELAGLGDKMATTIASPIKLFAKAGEGAMATLTRLSGNLTAANDAFKALGYRLFNVSIAGAGAASKFIDLFGSLDAFKTASDFYFQNFYSLSERTRYLASQFGASLSAIGQVKVPHTVEEFRAMVDALKAAGKDKAVAEMMKLAPMFTQLLELRSQIAAVGGSAVDTSEDLAKLQAVMQEREGLEVRLLTLMGNTAELRRRELAALDPSNRSLLVQILRLEDAAALQEKLNAIADKRKSLEEQLLRLQGNIGEIRKRELEAIDPTLRSLQRLIWGLEDAKEAIDALNPEDFASLFDFNQAKAKAGNSVNSSVFSSVRSNPPAAGYAPSNSVQRSKAQSDTEAMLAEIERLRSQIETLLTANNELAMATEKTNAVIAKILDTWNRNGMPQTIV